MNGALIIMGYIYNPDGFDWMNFKVEKNNPYTFHHIVERRRGGDKSINNGAILTNDAHKLLNILDIFFPDAYEDLQQIFIRINKSNEPPTYETMKEVDNILYKVFFTEEYEFAEGKDSPKYYRVMQRLLEYRKEYLNSRQKLTKCLE